MEFLKVLKRNAKKLMTNFYSYPHFHDLALKNNINYIFKFFVILKRYFEEDNIIFLSSS